MIDLEKINFKKDKTKISAARMRASFGQGLLPTILQILAIVGVLAVLILISSYQVENIPTLLRLPAALFVSVGLISGAFYIFIKNYFREVEDLTIIDSTKPTVDIYSMVDLELALILSKINLENPDLSIFVDILFKTRRANFVLSELNLSEEDIGGLISNLPKDVNTNIALKQIFANSVEYALEAKVSRLASGEILYGLMKTCLSYEQTLTALEISDEDVRNVIFWSRNLFDKYQYPKTKIEKLKASKSGIAQDWTSGYTNYLNQFGQDVTNPNLFGSFSIEGRENVIAQIEAVLTKEGKNNCILTGDVGVGKTSIVYGFAERVYWGNTVKQLAYKRVVYLDVSTLLSGIQDRGEANERLLGVLGDAIHAGNVILFIDDIHKLFTEGQDKVGTIDATEILAPYLQQSSIRVIGTTTNNYYQTYIEAKSQVSSNFEKIDIPPMNESQTLRILEDLSLHFSNKYNIRITYSSLKEIYSLAERFITNKEFPAKAVDMLTNACSVGGNQGMSILDKGAMDKVAETLLNVPVAEAGGQEKEKLLNMEQNLHERVIGQEEAVQAVADALRRARTRMSNTKRPVGSFLFLGPTGVGKTELAKALAAVYFGDEENMVRMDMNEYQDQSSIDRFIGRKIPGSEQLEGGEFVKNIRQRPFSVVLLDELEKAHKNILDLFLQMLDEGYITDGMGEKVILTNSIVIATSNAGANLIREAVAKEVDAETLKGNLLEYLQTENIYRPEFINRFDGVIVFRPLTKNQLLQIANLMFRAVTADMKKQGYVINIQPEALTYLIEVGYQPEFGARQMRRIMQDKIENYLAKKILSNEIVKGTPFVISLSDMQ